MYQTFILTSKATKIVSISNTRNEKHASILSQAHNHTPVWQLPPEGDAQISLSQTLTWSSHQADLLQKHTTYFGVFKLNPLQTNRLPLTVALNFCNFNVLTNFKCA